MHKQICARLYYLLIIISSGVRELFRARSSERSAEGNENRHGQVQRKHAHECTYAQHRLFETGRGAVKHTRVYHQLTPPAEPAPSQATRGDFVQQNTA